MTSRTLFQKKSSLVVRHLTSPDSLLKLAIKVVRLIISILILSVVASSFKKIYASERQTFDTLSPLSRFVNFYFAINFFANCILSLIVFIIIRVFDLESLKHVPLTSSIDFALGIIISYEISLNMCKVIEKKFDYSINGLTMVEALSRMMFDVIAINLFIPYYVIVFDLLGKFDLYTPDPSIKH